MKCASLNGFDLETGKKINAFPCGKCPPCRVNHRRKWTSRILLETLASEEAAFITLTYSDEHLPEGGELQPDHLSKFIRAVRDKIRGTQEKEIRYFGVGEYGDKFGRCHYHAIIWNYKPHFTYDPKSTRWYDPIIETAWGRGGTVTEDLMLSQNLTRRCEYVAGYVLKKMRNPQDKFPYKQPEFARMSRRPAVGTPAVLKMADTLWTRSGSILLAALGTVPSEYRYENRMLPIPSILRKKVADVLDIPCLPVPKSIHVNTCLQIDKVVGFGYGPPVEEEEDTPYKAFKRWEAMERRLRRESTARATKQSRPDQKPVRSTVPADQDTTQ